MSFWKLMQPGFFGLKHYVGIRKFSISSLWGLSPNLLLSFSPSFWPYTNGGFCGFVPSSSKTTRISITILSTKVYLELFIL